ncbi:MAG: hypothetical protein ACRD6N_15465, partial [Pyrinomonadaceae bacterium]
HVQTEDKGLDSPLILSLVYTGGTILASKRSPYQDLIASGFDEVVLADRLKRQHRLICAAIRAGRVEDLKLMSSRQPVTGRLVAPPAAQEIVESVAEKGKPSKRKKVAETAPPQKVAESVSEEPLEPSPPPPAAPMGEPYVVFDARRQAPTEPQPELEEGLRVSLLEEREFHSGESFSLGVLVSHKSAREDKPLSGIPVSVKVLGTTFRPVIVSVKTQKHGVAMIAVEIPRFSSGRAAILVRAVRGGESVEIRRVVHPA